MFLGHLRTAYIGSDMLVFRVTFSRSTRNQTWNVASYRVDIPQFTKGASDPPRTWDTIHTDRLISVKLSTYSNDLAVKCFLNA